MRRTAPKTRRASTRRATPRGATRRGRPAKGAGRKRAAAKRVTASRTARDRGTTRTASKPATAKRATTRATRRPALKAVRRPPRRTPKAAPPAAFPQARGASARSQLMFRMVKARASVMAAVQGMSAATAEQPFAAGKWNTRETILHLVTRDRARLREMEVALRGVQPSWNGLDPERQARVNEQDLAPLRHLGWEDAKRLLLATRQELMEAVESIPEQPETVWAEDHPLGWMFQRLPGHDLHHADIIKRWRTGPGA